MPRPQSRPFLVLISGLPGTGKSHFAQRLSGRLPAVILESDALRKVLFDKPDYGLEESGRLFAAMRTLAEGLLERGMPVIIDATNLTEEHRQHFYAVADRLDVKLVVRVVTPPVLVKERLGARRQEPGQKSDAGWEVYQRMAPSVETIKRRHFVVDNSKDVTSVLDRIVHELVKR